MYYPHNNHRFRSTPAQLPALYPEPRRVQFPTLYPEPPRVQFPALYPEPPVPQCYGTANAQFATSAVAAPPALTHKASAPCAECHRAKTFCDLERPCGRCGWMGFVDDCVEQVVWPPRKKRRTTQKAIKGSLVVVLRVDGRKLASVLAGEEDAEGLGQDGVGEVEDVGGEGLGGVVGLGEAGDELPLAGPGVSALVGRGVRVPVKPQRYRLAQ